MKFTFGEIFGAFLVSALYIALMIAVLLVWG